ERVDVVDVSTADGSRARDSNVACERLRPVRREDVVAVRRYRPERCDDEPQDDEGHDEIPQPERHVSQRSPRVSPPSTGMTVPVMYAARSEHRKATRSPISRGVPSLRTG